MGQGVVKHQYRRRKIFQTLSESRPQHHRDPVPDVVRRVNPSHPATL